ncbi:MAG: (2Fe-2S) ferredoxin domain-containing protein [bacterium]|nr:(2Fe-2S) ferredoxin domain-containing protein [Myxococcales bacterium]
MREVPVKREARGEVSAGWSHVVLVCRKCSKKLDGGFGEGGDERLAKALRRRLGARKGRKGAVGVVEVGCLDVCPKRAVMVVDSRRPRQWRVVPAGADVDVLAEALR